MKKKKTGFTLIELLAIIVILAIIAVITVPIILNIIENSRKGAATNSAYGYKDAVQKYYVSELSNNNNLKLQGTYTVLNGILSGDGVNNVDIQVSGTKPSSGNLHYTNNILDDGCIVIGDYKVTFNNDGSVNETVKGNCEDYVISGGSGQSETPEPSIPESISFAEDSWATIKANLAADRDFYDIGSEKIVNMNLEGTAKNYKLRLVNTESCSNDWEGSKTACGVVIEFVTTIGNHGMNSSNTNEGGWYASSMRAYLNSETNNIYSKLPSDLQNVIISTTPVISSAGYGNDTNGGGVSNNAEDYLYLLSTREVGLSISFDNKSAATDTNILSYYNSNNNSNARIKYSATTSEGDDSSASWYWTRSAFSDNSGTFYCLDNGGGSGNITASYAAGVAPAFRILD